MDIRKKMKATGINIDNDKHYKVNIVRKKEPLLKTIVSILSYALFIWLLLIGIVLLIYVADIKIRAMKGDYTPPKFNAYVVLTGSMLPEIEPSDVVVTKKVKEEKLKVGDIVTFYTTDPRFAGIIVTHRIVEILPTNNGYEYRTKGDNNNTTDSALIDYDDMVGKVILKIPKLGYVQTFLATKGGWIFVILIPCLVIISYDIMKLGKNAMAKSKKKSKRKLVYENK